MIKWRDKDLKKLSRYVGKFNSALTRLAKSRPEFADSGLLPERKSVEEAKRNILTRADYNRYINAIDRFFKKDAKNVTTVNGVKMLKYTKKENQYLAQRVTKRRRDVVKKYKLAPDEASRLNLGDVNINRELDKVKKGGDLQEFYNFLYSLEREASGEYFNETLFKVLPSYKLAIRNNIGGIDAEILINKLEQAGVTSADILLAMGENKDFDFEYLYSLEERQGKIELLNDLFNKRFTKKE